MEKTCKLDPFGKTKCYREDVDFNTYLLCQLYWIRGLLTAVDMIEKILKRSVTEEERKMIEEMYKEGKTLTEILEELKRK